MLDVAVPHAQPAAAAAAGWSPSSWRSRPARQMPAYEAAERLSAVEARLRTLSMVLGLVEGPDPGICIDEPIERFLGESKEIRVFSG